MKLNWELKIAQNINLASDYQSLRHCLHSLVVETRGTLDYACTFNSDFPGFSQKKQIRIPDTLYSVNTPTRFANTSRLFHSLFTKLTKATRRPQIDCLQIKAQSSTQKKPTLTTITFDHGGDDVTGM